MPTISMFYGIIVRMYCSPKSGEIPVKKLRLVQAWIELHSDELIANWKLVTNGELPFKIEPLR